MSKSGGFFWKGYQKWNLRTFYSIKIGVIQMRGKLCHKKGKWLQLLSHKMHANVFPL